MNDGGGRDETIQMDMVVLILLMVAVIWLTTFLED
jgi:hypothetical protein